MVELLFVVCLAASPQECQERSLVFTEITPQACMAGAQPQLAKWAVTHPAYRIQRWMCRHVVYGQHDV